MVINASVWISPENGRDLEFAPTHVLATEVYAVTGNAKQSPLYC